MAKENEGMTEHNFDDVGKGMHKHGEGTMKTSKEADNTEIGLIDRLMFPQTSTMIDRYVFANSWTKGK